MPSVAPVAVRRLNKDGCFREALSIHLAPDVVEPHAFADVSTGLLDHTITVHVGEKPQTESIKKRLHHQDWFKQQSTETCRQVKASGLDIQRYFLRHEGYSEVILQTALKTVWKRDERKYFVKLGALYFWCKNGEHFNHH